MSGRGENRPPEADQLMPNGTNIQTPHDTSGSDTVKLKRTLGLFNGVALIVGSIVGSGIFVSPKGVLMEAESVGLSLLIWLLCGFICLLGALAFSELGTLITRSGGMYAYIHVAFGDLAAFVYMWAALLIIFPAANAVIALTFAYYCLQPIFPHCDAPESAIRIVAALALGLLSYINCMSVKWATRVQDIFTIIKTLALILIIITGIVVLAMGHTSNFDNMFDGSTKDLGRISLAFYSGLFSYSGWYTLNFLTEELKNPFQNLPRAIWISMPMVTIIYFFANVAYFAVLTPAEIMASDAVAVTFAQRMYGVMSWTMPLFVAFSTFGSLNGCILCTARVFFVGARQGHLPDVIALIHIKRFTPFPSVFLQGLISVAMLVTSDVYLLINYVTFIESLSFLVCTLALLWLRYKYPEWNRPIKVNIAIPIIFTIVCVFLLILPLYQSPFETLIGLAILVSGIPVYWICVLWKNKPKVYHDYITRMTHFCQKLILGVLQEGDID